MAILIPSAGSLRPSGQTTLVDAAGNRTTIEHDTLQCVHCQHHWRVVVGSGRVRGYCRRCMGPTCGAKVCVDECEPWEKGADRREAEARLIIRLEP